VQPYACERKTRPTTFSAFAATAIMTRFVAEILLSEWSDCFEQ
jgi:hypothetical protein